MTLTSMVPRLVCLTLLATGSVGAQSPTVSVGLEHWTLWSNAEAPLSTLGLAASVGLEIDGWQVSLTAGAMSAVSESVTVLEPLTFWVVRPEVKLTVVSGEYVSGVLALTPVSFVMPVGTVRSTTNPWCRLTIGPLCPPEDISTLAPLNVGTDAGVAMEVKVSKHLLLSLTGAFHGYWFLGDLGYGLRVGLSLDVRFDDE